jgi:Cu/Ag efflux protein CusF
LRPQARGCSHRTLQALVGALLFIAGSGCGHRSEQGAEKYYALSGKVIALNRKDQTATVDAAAIPNFMEAMTMEYPVPSKTDFGALHVGEKIKATVTVREDGLYSLSHIQPLEAAR